jgi:lysophospholipase L1-like esterase
MKRLNVLLAVLVSLLMALLCLEIGLRVIGLGPPVTLNEPHPTLGWAKKRDQVLTRRTSEGFDVRYALNRHGLRDDEAPGKPAGVFRVVVLGDSFTLGTTVERADLFVDLLEQRLRAEGRPVEVVNAGTEGWSTDQEVVWLLEEGLAYQPDLVLLMAYENDLAWNAEPAYYGTPKPRFAEDGSRMTGELPLAPARGFVGRTALGNLLQGRPSPKLFQPPGAARPILEEWAPLLVEPPAQVEAMRAHTRGALRALQAACAGRGCQAVVVPIPSHSAVDPDYGRERFAPMALGGLPEAAWSADRPVELFLEEAAAVGLPTLDPRPFLRARFAEGGEDLYFSVDWHLNPAGNRALAELLHDGLDGLGLLPPARQAVAASAAPTAPAPPNRVAWAFLGLWIALGGGYAWRYRAVERPALAVLKVGALLGVVFGVAIGGAALLALLPPLAARLGLVAVVFGLLGFIAWKLGDRVETIAELLLAFIRRGHWYLMPLLVVLLTVGSLLVVAASSPLMAPFIYTLF